MIYSRSSKPYKKQLVNNQPIQYKRGYVEFYKLKFRVTPDVLIPRPETELLVDEVVRFVASRRTANDEPITILDVGTGSGCIAISIAKNLKQYPTSEVGYSIIAADLSEKALAVARKNAELHGVEKKITFVQSDLLSSSDFLPLMLNTRYLILVTNLPYIPSARIPFLDASVKDFEPRIALNGGRDGFELYRKLFRQLKGNPWGPKLIVGEIDYTHGELAFKEAHKFFPNAKIEVKNDLAHKQRILLIRQFL